MQLYLCEELVFRDSRNSKECHMAKRVRKRALW